MTMPLMISILQCVETDSLWSWVKSHRTWTRSLQENMSSCRDGQEAHSKRKRITTKYTVFSSPLHFLQHSHIFSLKISLFCFILSKESTENFLFELATPARSKHNSYRIRIEYCQYKLYNSSRSCDITSYNFSFKYFSKKLTSVQNNFSFYHVDSSRVFTVIVNILEQV